MTRRFHTTGMGTQWVIPPAMSEARRQHVHGPLVERPVFTLRGFIGGVLVVAGALAGIVALVLFIEASDAPPASSIHASSGVEAAAPGNTGDRL